MLILIGFIAFCLYNAAKRGMWNEICDVLGLILIGCIIYQLHYWAFGASLVP